MSDTTIDELPTKPNADELLESLRVAYATLSEERNRLAQAQRAVNQALERANKVEQQFDQFVQETRQTAPHGTGWNEAVQPRFKL